MANKKDVRTDRFVSKAGDFTVVKPAPKSGSKSSGSKSGSKTKK